MFAVVSALRVADGPSDAADDEILELGAGPHVLAMAHRRVKHTAGAVFANPGGGIGGALVRRALHAGGFVNQDHVQVIREIL